MNQAEAKQIWDEIRALPFYSFPKKKERLAELKRVAAESERAGVKKYAERAEKELRLLEKEENRLSGMRSWEHSFAPGTLVAGVDEVGRGPLAGPILCAAVILPEDVLFPYCNDSKQVKEQLREELYAYILKNAVAVGIGERSPEEIDSMGIAPADNDSMRDAVLALDPLPGAVLVDAFPIKGLEIPQKAIIKGDTLSLSIAAASIVAKVTRDRMMVEYDRLYPEYGFAAHKGYGTKQHMDAIRKYGLCPIHRRSFIPDDLLAGL